MGGGDLRVSLSACADRTRDYGCKLTEIRFRLDTRKKIFTARMVMHWHRFPRQAVDVASLEASKVRLGGALSKLIWLQMSLLIAGGLDLISIKAPANQNHLWLYIVYYI